MNTRGCHDDDGVGVDASRIVWTGQLRLDVVFSFTSASAFSSQSVGCIHLTRSGD